MSTNVNKGLVGGQKRPKNENVVLEWPLTYKYLQCVAIAEPLGSVSPDDDVCTA